MTPVCPRRGAAPRYGAALDHHPRGQRAWDLGTDPLSVTILTTSVGSPGQASGSSPRHLGSGTVSGFPWTGCPCSSQVAAACPSGAGLAELLPRCPPPRLGGISLPRHRAEGTCVSSEISPAVGGSRPGSMERALSIYFCSFSFQDEIKLQRAKNKPFFKAMHQRIP